VHFLEHVDGLGRSLLHARTIRHVQLDGVHAIARLLEVFHRLVEMGLGAIGNDDLHARVRERAGHAQPDAAVPSGDEGNFALDVLHGRCPGRATGRGGIGCQSGAPQTGHQRRRRSGCRKRRPLQEATAGAARLSERALG
jgi:hypothetical protein